MMVASVCRCPMLHCFLVSQVSRNGVLWFRIKIIWFVYDDETRTHTIFSVVFLSLLLYFVLWAMLCLAGGARVFRSFSSAITINDNENDSTHMLTCFAGALRCIVRPACHTHTHTHAHMHTCTALVCTLYVLSHHPKQTTNPMNALVSGDLSKWPYFALAMSHDAMTVI